MLIQLIQEIKRHLLDARVAPTIRVGNEPDDELLTPNLRIEFGAVIFHEPSEFVQHIVVELHLHCINPAKPPPGQRNVLVTDRALRAIKRLKSQAWSLCRPVAKRSVPTPGLVYNVLTIEMEGAAVGYPSSEFARNLHLALELGTLMDLESEDPDTRRKAQGGSEND